MTTEKNPLPVTLLFTALMAALVWFFAVSGSRGTASPWIYAAFALGVFFAILATGEVSRWRRLYMTSVAVAFAISFMGILIDERGSVSIPASSIINAETPFCHIVIPVALIPYALTKTVIFPARMTGHFAALTSMLAIWFIATVTIGRGWCSWVCFYGGWEDGLSRVAKKERLPLAGKNREVRAFHFAFLFFIALVSLGFMSSVYCQWFCPFKLVTEFEPVTDFAGLLVASVFILAFFGLVVAMPILTRKRFQCSAICPFGAFQSLLDPVSSYRIVIDTGKCVSCMKCVAACPFFAIDRETIARKRGKPELTCAKCGECADVCPQNAIRYEYSFAAKKKRSCADGPKNRTLRAILDPKNLFLFSAFALSMIITSRFFIDALDRVFAHAAGGL